MSLLQNTIHTSTPRPKRRWRWLLLPLVIGLIIFWRCLPHPLFTDSTSAVLLDRHGSLLDAQVAADGQWRFPYNPQVPQKFKQAIIHFEDKRFYAHPGVDPVALLRAIYTQLGHSKIKSGGSTLTMQVIRLARNGQPRTITEKLIEIIMALRLECSYSKNAILALYASHAPFGSNVVGLDAAAWRYFGKSPANLSWGEAATLAVLPNSPALVNPGKNRVILKAKRDKLLIKLREAKVIDSVTCMLAQAEPLPGKPVPLPQYAPHLLTRLYNENFRNNRERPTIETSTLDKNLQLQVNDIVLRHNRELQGNNINNAAALVADVETGEVLAYVGNVYTPNHPVDGADVDVITAPRSYGSVLKPVLFSAMLTGGDLLPSTLVPDIPTQIAGYSPQNFNREYDGAVPARRALERSLNVPAVRMLRHYGIEKFNYLLKQLGITTLNQPAGYYGLSIILGGAEGNMWDIAGVYADMARTLNHFTANKATYNGADIHPLYYTFSQEKGNKKSVDKSSLMPGLINAASIWCTFNAMEEVNRPDMETNWKEFSSSLRVAWKTGTSFGFRDGWAVGCTPRYVVIVWVGNATGEGRPGLVGVATAAPIMFDIFKLLKSSPWFAQPYSEMKQIDVCAKSGYRALGICESTQSIWVPFTGLKTPPCPYHQIIHLDPTGQWRVNSDCAPPSQMQHVSWFVLPPAEEWYYKSKKPGYRVLPPFKPGCTDLNKQSVMEFIYPKKSTQLYIPVELDGKTGKAVFEVAHRSPDAILYWSLD
ncbi:MAG TPA: penicillin-binding protein 1C, partial [Chitinophagales bacterium]|nr:penicillin-binding protein 1C [Chitinophagales bacterium]